jgi:hypothetical protein
MARGKPAKKGQGSWEPQWNALKSDSTSNWTCCPTQDSRERNRTVFWKIEIMRKLSGGLKTTH